MNEVVIKRALEEIIHSIEYFLSEQFDYRGDLGNFRRVKVDPSMFDDDLEDNVEELMDDIFDYLDSIKDSI